MRFVDIFSPILCWLVCVSFGFCIIWKIYFLFLALLDLHLLPGLSPNCCSGAWSVLLYAGFSLQRPRGRKGASCCRVRALSTWASVVVVMAPGLYFVFFFSNCFLLVDIQFFQHHLLKRLFFPCWIVFAPFLWIDYKCEDLFSNFLFCSIDLYIMLVLMLVVTL